MEKDHAASTSPTKQLHDLSENIRKQYGTPSAIAFYQAVMGGGGHHIHFGIVQHAQHFPNAASKVRSAGEAAVSFLTQQVQKFQPLPSAMRILDVGSGLGGAAHVLAKTHGVYVVGLNLCAQQNQVMLEESKRQQTQHLITAKLGNFDHPWPTDWEQSFDLVWSQEAFCHSTNKYKLFQQIHQALVQDGMLAFTDIMAGEEASAEQLRSFTDQNATTEMATPAVVKDLLAKTGFKLLQHDDLTAHLPAYLQAMIDALDASKPKLTQQHDVDEAYMHAFRSGLERRIQSVHQGVFRWGAFVARKDNKPHAAQHTTQDSSTYSRSTLPVKISMHAPTQMPEHTQKRHS
ncbi:MAG: class I SAM-dependent methyltransferase [Myxococcota bacterium]